MKIELNAEINAVEHFINHFAVTGKVDKRTGQAVYFDLDKAQEKAFIKGLKTNPFFGKINIFTTGSRTGEALGLQIPLASTTDTQEFDRNPRSITAKLQKFSLEQINVDTFVKYAKFDAFLLDEDLSKLIDGYIQNNTFSALARVGWNGKKRVKNSDPDTNGLCEDVAIGWLQKIRENAPNSAIESDSLSATSKNALIRNALAKIDTRYKSGGEMVILCGRGMAENCEFTEQGDHYLREIKSTLGGMKAYYCSHFPDNAFLITRFDNISLYIQRATLRKMLIDTPEKDRIEHYFSLSLDFIIEDFNAVLLVENVKSFEA